MITPDRLRRLLLLVAFLAATSWTTPSAAVEIIGHRGASHDAPENTLASIKLAWKQNADAAEIDVYLSQDGQIVTIHDSDTKRVGGLDRPVAAQTLAELKQLDVGRWKGPQFAGERIPTLAEVVATIPAGKRLFIEVKCGPEIARPLAAVLAASRKRPAQTCVISFSFDVVTRVKQELPQIQCYWLVELKQDQQTGLWSPPLDDLIRKTKAAGLDGLDFGTAPLIDRRFVSRIKQSGLGVYIWTVNALEEADRLEQAGVDGITTDRPGFLRQHFRQRP